MTFINNKLHIFDCDGVILDSNFSKIRAIECTLEELNVPKDIVDICALEFKKNFGRTRLNHFKKFGEVFIDHGRGDLLNTINKGIKVYSTYVKEMYSNSSVINETILFIEQIKSKDNIYIVSASDQDELREVLPTKLKVISKDQIFGGPEKKDKNISNILKSNNFDNAILYGDSIHDAKAAIKTKINFLGLLKYSADPLSLINFCKKYSLNYTDTLINNHVTR